tara:strand:- start:17089 stop:17823 length:735 start_codon:yes stop_codon:yes gene_type:complete
VTEPGADIYDPEFVKGVFDRCSGKYIAFSYVCSMGFTEFWRSDAVKILPDPGKPNPVGYDLMAGTGEVWPHLMKRFPDIAEITAIDISEGMHKRALDRLHAGRTDKIGFICDNVLNSELPPDSCDFVISTFGLKTFDQSQQAQLADLVARILKPGGSFSFIEASDPKDWLLRPLYLFHLKTVLPVVEKLFLSGAQDFAMIGSYSTNFGNAKFFGDCLRQHGLEVRFKKHFFGCATSVSGHKPQG